MSKPLSDRVATLRAYLLSGLFVRIRRRFEEAPIHGYVLGVGQRFFLVGVINDRLWDDGFECFRIADLRAIEPDPHAQFVEAALARRGVPRPTMPPVDLDGIRVLLQTAGKAFALVTLHPERTDPEICHVGQIVTVGLSAVALRAIGPDARWASVAETHALRTITRVNFGGDYEDALVLVGGAVPD